MQYSTCKKNIEEAVYRVKGVSFVHVSKRDKIAEINYDNTKTDLARLEHAITTIGYDANDKKADTVAYMYLKRLLQIAKRSKGKTYSLKLL